MRVLSALLLLGSTGIAQTIHQIPADSKGNQLVLTVEGKNVAGTSTVVEVIRRPSAMTFPSAVLQYVASGSPDEVKFAFDVTRMAKIGKVDTILLSVRNGSRDLLATKEVLIQYAGPSNYRLEQNFPNPFNPSTTIQFQLPEASTVRIVVFDLLGRESAVVLDEERPAGFHDVVFEARSLASGAYFCRMIAEGIVGKGSHSETKRMLLLR
jgi:hypothetical protein